MPIHDWTRVDAGIFHHFHHRWITAISDALNGGILPADYYALAEQVTGDIGPDVVALKLSDHNKGAGAPAGNGVGTLTLAETPPRVRITAEAQSDAYVRKQNAVLIYHTSDDTVVALVEIMSSGNKAKTRAYRTFLDKALSALAQGIHLLIIDLFPPTKRDPQGLHGALWSELTEEEAYRAPGDKPLTVAAYASGHPIRAFVEPVAVGQAIPDMPLFLEAGAYVSTSLEKTYQDAWRGVPKRWQDVLDQR